MRQMTGSGFLRHYLKIPENSSKMNLLKVTHENK